MKDFHTHHKVIGMACIAPILAAKVFKGTNLIMTMGGVKGDKWPHAGAS